MLILIIRIFHFSSNDGSILAVGAFNEAGVSSGVGGSMAQNTTTSSDSGAMYVYFRNSSGYFFGQYLKASNSAPQILFGYAAQLSASGKTLAVAASQEKSRSTGIGGSQVQGTTPVGAVYIFEQGADATQWTQTQYIKASNARSGYSFGQSVALSSDGLTLVVGDSKESSGATGINGNQSDTSTLSSGAVYVFVRPAVSSSAWTQDAYIKGEGS